MTRTRFTTARRLRRGFTLIELLVVISIIAVLASLIAPAVQSARRAARKMECGNNIRQVGIAMQSFASSNGGQLPSLVGNSTFSSTAAGGNVTLATGWPIQIMPAMDGAAYVKNLRANALATGYAVGGLGFVQGGTNTNVTEKKYFKGFTCPDDVNSDKVAGGLSYVVNIGLISSQLWPAATASVCADDNLTTTDIQTGTTYHNAGLVSWDGNSTRGEPTDIAINMASGVFQRDLTGHLNGGTGTSAPSTAMSLDYVGTGDGTTNTLMLAENLQAGSWWDSTANRLGFGIIVTASPAVSFGSGNPSSSTSQPLKTDHTGSTFTTQADPWFINRNLGAAVGSSPRPSSQHAGGVNVVFCDGSTRFLSENMDKSTYAKLLTSNGVTYGESTLDGSY